MESGRFIIQISPDLIIDLAAIDKNSWENLRKNASYMVKTGQIEDPGMAYIAAFLIYIQDLEALLPEFDPSNDKMM